MRNPEEFLQFLYDQNIISYIEDADGERFIRWCFIERTPSNIAPKVKTDSDYEIHYGLANVLNIGKEIKRKGRNVLGNVVGHSRAKTTPSKIGINKEEHQGRNSQRGAPPAPPISGGESVPRLASTVQRGTIRMFDPRKGFGLIDRTDGPPVSFVRSSLRHKFRPARGQSVTFTTPLNRERKQHAANIELVDDSAAPSQKK
jgi:cold shock CspA family protein